MPSSAPTARTSSLKSIRSGSTQGEVELIRQAADVVVGLDRRGVIRCRRTRSRPSRGCPWTRNRRHRAGRLLLEDADELLADDLALALGVFDPGQLGEEALFGVDVNPAECRTGGMPRPPARPRSCASTRGPTKTQVSLSPHRLVDEQRRDRGIDSTGEPARSPCPRPPWSWILATCSAITDCGRPLLLAAGDIAQEAGQDLGSVRGVDDLGVELDPVEAAIRQLTGGNRRAGAGGESAEALRRLEDRVAVTSSSSSAPPAGRPAGGRHRRAEPGRCDRTRPSRPTRPGHRGRGPLPASRNRSPVSGSRDRAAGSGNGGAPARRPRPAAGEDEGLGRALADLLDRRGRRQQLGEDPAFADPAGNQLRVLAPEVEDQQPPLRRARRRPAAR